MRPTGWPRGSPAWLLPLSLVCALGWVGALLGLGAVVGPRRGGRTAALVLLVLLRHGRGGGRLPGQRGFGGIAAPARRQHGHGEGHEQAEEEGCGSSHGP